jgi:hypothetical protein
MRPCWREHGNAYVKIGITGEGKAPFHKVTYFDESGLENLYGWFANSVMGAPSDAEKNSFSTASMSYEKVEQLIASIRGFVIKSR